MTKHECNLCGKIAIDGEASSRMGFRALIINGEGAIVNKISLHHVLDKSRVHLCGRCLYGLKDALATTTLPDLRGTNVA